MLYVIVFVWLGKFYSLMVLCDYGDVNKKLIFFLFMVDDNLKWFKRMFNKYFYIYGIYIIN